MFMHYLMLSVLYKKNRISWKGSRLTFFFCREETPLHYIYIWVRDFIGKIINKKQKFGVGFSEAGTNRYSSWSYSSYSFLPEGAPVMKALT